MRSGASAESSDEDSRNTEVWQPEPAQTGEGGKLFNTQEPKPVHIDFVPYTHIVSSTSDFITEAVYPLEGVFY